MNSSMLRLRYRRHLWTAVMVAMLAALTVSAPAAAREPGRPDLPDRGNGQELEWKPTRTSNANTIDVVSANAFLYGDGTVAVVGDVLSTMTSRREGVTVNVNFYNGTTLIGSLGASIFLIRLAYGSTSPFLVYDEAPEGTEPGVTTFQVYVDDVGTAVSAPPGGALRIVPGPTTIVGDFRHFTGTIHNVSNAAVLGTFVAVTTYDSAGDVIDSDYDVTSPDTIPAGGSAPYDVQLFYDPGTPVARSAVTTDAFRADFETYHTAWGNYFNDVGVSSFRSDIVWNADQGITTGCGAGLFCPTANVPRDQMASFLSRALDLSGPAPNAYTDDNGNPHEPNINLVAREGIASGCTATTYCPAANVTRGQMAAFLHRAFD
jgi:hypothetical protein